MLVRTLLGGEASPLPTISTPTRSTPYASPKFMDRGAAANLMACHPSRHVAAVLQVSRHYFDLPGSQER
jgi:hypothetical protein